MKKGWEMMKKIAVIYWSGTGHTEAMAKAICRGLEKQGVRLYRVDEFQNQDLQSYDAILFGCPSMGCEVLEEAEFEPFFSEAEAFIKEKPVGLFGSYGWGNGEWMRDWEERVKERGARLFESGIILEGSPGPDGERLCEAFGERFDDFISKE